MPAPPEIQQLIDTAAQRLESEMVPCPRCTGKGYHHGFGEGGHDPDWCVDCGGSGYVSQDPKVILAEFAALVAALGAPARTEAKDHEALSTSAVHATPDCAPARTVGIVGERAVPALRGDPGARTHSEPVESAPHDLADAWWRGRRSVDDLDPRFTTGPQLQARCAADLAKVRAGSRSPLAPPSTKEQS